MCNGSTYDSDSYCLGSNPSSAANLPPWSSGQDVALSRRKLGFDSLWWCQLSPHVLIQSMRTSFCIYRLINRQNTGYNHQIWAIGARSELLGVILSDGGFYTPALFSLLTPAFRGRNQRFIKKCTLLWTIAGYRPQCEVSSKVSQNNVKCPHKSGHGKSPNPNSWTKKSPTPRIVNTLRYR